EEMLNNAKWDAEQYVKLVGASDPDATLQLCVVYNNLGVFTRNKDYNRNVLNIINKLLTSQNLTTINRASAMSSRGVALDNVGETEAARKSHTEAIALNPDSPIMWSNRARFFQYNNQANL